MNKIVTLLILTAAAALAAPDRSTPLQKSSYDLHAPGPAVKDPAAVASGQTANRAPAIPHSLAAGAPALLRSPATGAPVDYNSANYAGANIHPLADGAPAMLHSMAASTAQAGEQAQGLLLTLPASELALVSGGYFTIGTTAGVTASPLDDRCGVTWGHPYALTSTPLLAIDGRWGPAADFFPAAALIPQRRGDTLFVTGVTPDSCRFRFALAAAGSGAVITLEGRVTNLSSSSRSLGLGLLLDPALGLWGDGQALHAGSPLTTAVKLPAAALGETIEIRERAEPEYGLGLACRFSASRPDLIAGNWPDLYTRPGPAWPGQAGQAIYDLALEFLWQEELIAPGGSRTFAITAELLPPRFGEALFTRWDLPAALALEANVIWPRTLTTHVQIANLSGTTWAGVSLELQSQPGLVPAAASISATISPDSLCWLPVTFTSQELYEDAVAAVTLQLRHGGQLLDALTRPVFIPGVPLSDTGLVVQIDTVEVSRFPAASLRFSCQAAATQQLLTGLTAQNIFLYENDQRVREFTISRDTTGGANAADIVFVLDVTGSMGDEINDVKSHIIEFADSLSARGVDYRLGMVTFLDEIENVYPFSRDVQSFQRLVAQQYAHGGGDTPENSLAALKRAAEFPFRGSARRLLIWITDANYHEANSFTPLRTTQVVNQLLAGEIIVHAIGATSFKSAYDPIYNATGGNYYDIYGNFRDILLDISRLQAMGRFWIGWTSAFPSPSARTTKLEIHYAGFGGSQTVTWSPAGGGRSGRLLSCWPNPFNPLVRLSVTNPRGASGEINIYNLLGQRVRHYVVPPGLESRLYSWDARDESGQPVGAGHYFVELLLREEKSRTREVGRILYLK